MDAPTPRVQFFLSLAHNTTANNAQIPHCGYCGAEKCHSSVLDSQSLSKNACVHDLACRLTVPCLAAWGRKDTGSSSSTINQMITICSHQSGKKASFSPALPLELRWLVKVQCKRDLSSARLAHRIFGLGIVSSSLCFQWNRPCPILAEYVALLAQMSPQSRTRPQVSALEWVSAIISTGHLDLSLTTLGLQGMRVIFFYILNPPNTLHCTAQSWRRKPRQQQHYRLGEL